MRIGYSTIAGQSLERLAALSDGIFAVAMTLLVLDLGVPEGISSDDAMWGALVKLAPRLAPYFMSFLTLGIFWLGQQTQLNFFARGNRNLAWIHLIFLLFVTLMPFSTRLLAGNITSRLALVIYTGPRQRQGGLNLFFLGVMLFSSWAYAERGGLLNEEVTDEIRSANRRRIVVYQALYACGALLCVINTYVSVAFIVLLQLNSVLAPRIRFLDRF